MPTLFSPFVLRRHVFSLAASLLLTALSVAGTVSQVRAEEETGVMTPGLDAAQTHILILPTLAPSNVPAEAAADVTSEVKHQFTMRGFALSSDSDVTTAAANFKQSSDLTMDNLVRAGRAANADYVSVVSIEKIKTFAWYEAGFSNRTYYRIPSRQWVNPLSLVRSVASVVIPFAGFLQVVPNNKFGATLHTYLIDVKNSKAILMDHKTYGNSEKIVWGNSPSKAGKEGAAQEGTLFIMSRTLREYHGK